MKRTKWCWLLALALTVSLACGAVTAMAEEPSGAVESIPAASQTKTLWSFSGWTPSDTQIMEPVADGLLRVTDKTTAAQAGGGSRIQIWSTSNADYGRDLNYYFGVDAETAKAQIQVAIFLSVTGGPHWSDAPMTAYFDVAKEPNKEGLTTISYSAAGTGASEDADTETAFVCSPERPVKLTVRIGAETTELLCNDAKVDELSINQDTFKEKVCRPGFSIVHSQDFAAGQGAYIFGFNGEPSVTAAGSFNTNSTNDAKFEIDEDYAAFVELYCDRNGTSQLVENKNYSYVSGANETGVLTLKYDYLKSLQLTGQGEIPFRLRYTSRDVSAKLSYTDEKFIDFALETTFNKAGQAFDVAVNGWNGGEQISLWNAEGEKLTDVQATVDTEGNRFSFAADYVRSLPVGKYIYTVKSNYADAAMTIVVKNTAKAQITVTPWVVSEEDLALSVDLRYNLFAGLANVSEENYSFDAESGTLTLKAAYLKTLKNGKNNFHLQTDNGETDFSLMLDLFPLKFAAGQDKFGEYQVQAGGTLTLKLDLNERGFKGVEGLKTNTDYIWDGEKEELTFSANYLTGLTVGEHTLNIQGQYNGLAYSLFVDNEKSPELKGASELIFTDATAELKWEVAANGGKFLKMLGGNIPADKATYQDGIIKIDTAWLKSSAAQSMTFAAVFDNGTVQISVKDGRTAPAFTIGLQNSAASVALGGTITLMPAVTPDGAVILWTSSNTKIVSVAQDGTVTGVGLGEATVTATVGAQSVSCLITVKPEKGAGCAGSAGTAAILLSIVLLAGAFMLLSIKVGGKR